MYRVVLEHDTDFAGWRSKARDLLARCVEPDEVVWLAGGNDDLFADAELPPVRNEQPVNVPRGFVELAETVVLHSDPQRFALLYRVLWRLRGEPKLLHVAVDPDVAQLNVMAKAVRRDIHKMRAFVRFRKTKIDDVDWYVAWFEPEHHIVEDNAPFFMRRFANMNWSILTPDISAHWNGEKLAFGPGCQRSDAPDEDALEKLWRGYYASIFNPARLKVGAMRNEMPVKYWKNLPEAALIKPLIDQARRRSEDMVKDGPTAPNVRPQRPSPSIVAPAAEAGTLEALRAEAAGCRACPLWEPATQTVFGAGAAHAAVMFVGEQPGDQEDLEGKPFVGPAGQLFDRALAEAGVDRRATYVTNAVKHFKYIPRGKRRLHQRPNAGEISICRQWLKREIDLVQPRLIVALGATAVQSVLGKALPITKSRGQFFDLDNGRRALITVHPSYLLRLPDEAARATEYGNFVQDLRLTRQFIAAQQAA